MFSKIEFRAKAIKQMKLIILELVQDSINQSFYKKAINSIKSLRKACVQEEEFIPKFNKFLQKMNTIFSNVDCQDFLEMMELNEIILIPQQTVISKDSMHLVSSNYLIQKYSLVGNTKSNYDP